MFKNDRLDSIFYFSFALTTISYIWRNIFYWTNLMFSTSFSSFCSLFQTLFHSCRIKHKLCKISCWRKKTNHQVDRTNEFIEWLWNSQRNIFRLCSIVKILLPTSFETKIEFMTIDWCWLFLNFLLQFMQTKSHQCPKKPVRWKDFHRVLLFFVSCV